MAEVKWKEEKEITKTTIEWVKNQDGTQGYTINPIKGLCPVACDYCYARRIYKRFHLRSDGTINPIWDYNIRMEPDWQKQLPKIPAKIFVGSTMELFGDWVEDWMWDSIWQYVSGYPQHTFIFLTKRPENLPKEFPSNCWVGVSITHQEHFADRLYDISKVKANVKFISFEPLLQGVNGSPLSNLKLAGISWVIIGQQTPASIKTSPKMSWIQEILVAAHNAGNIPVFVKENLRQLIDKEWPGWNILQEFPE